MFPKKEQENKVGVLLVQWTDGFKPRIETIPQNLQTESSELFPGSQMRPRMSLK